MADKKNVKTKKIARGDNVRFNVDGDDLVIRVCLNEDKVDVQPSKSGKTMVISSIRAYNILGDTPLGEDGPEMGVFLTVYKK